MGTEVIIFLIVLAVLVGLFLFTKLPYDASALAVLIIIYLLGFVDKDEAISGFSSPAIVVFVTTLILSLSLKKTGIASRIAFLLANKASGSELKNIIYIMLLGGVVSGLMSNVAAVALLLPTVISIGQINRINPSKLLMPLAFSVIVGGLLTQIGSTANIVASETIASGGGDGFWFFSFFPFGASFLIAGIVFMAFLGKYLLPETKRDQLDNTNDQIRKIYRLHEEVFYISLHSNSPLVNKTVAQTELGSRLGLRIMAIFNEKGRNSKPHANYKLEATDKLLVYGSVKKVQSIISCFGLHPEAKKFIQPESYKLLSFDNISHYESVVKETPYADFRLNNFAKFSKIDEQLQLESTQSLTKNNLPFYLLMRTDVELPEELNVGLEQIDDQQFSFLIPAGSGLIGKNPNALNTVNRLGFKIIQISRDETRYRKKEISELKYGDRVYCAGKETKVANLSAFSGIEINLETPTNVVEAADISLTEVALSPRSSLIGKSLAAAEFSSRYELQVLAVWRNGAPIRGNLANLVLNFGDGLLVQGSKQKIYYLNEDSDFLPLYNAVTPEREDKAKYALIALAVMIILSVFKVLPLHFATLIAALIVIFSGAIKTSEAYEEMPWHVVILVAALIPFGIAFTQSGTADFVSSGILALTSGGGLLPTALILALAACLISQALDVVIAVILIGQIALSISVSSGLPANALIMAVTCGASFAFLTPFSHKANLLVMGPGGYRNKDFFKMGLPFTVLMFGMLMLVLAVVY